MPPKIDFRREVAAEQEIGRTLVRAPVRRLLVAAFVLTIFGVPAIQYFSDAGSAEFRGRSWRPHAAEILRAFPNAWHAAAREGGIRDRLAAANASLKKDFKAFEATLEEESFLSRHALPRVQQFSARFLGLGNEKVYLGQDGWLFYRPDVDYLFGPGFLDPSVLRMQRKDRGVQPDPRPAILRLHEDLAARGIRLLVVPIPVKPQIEGEHLSARCSANPLQNPSFPGFLEGLRKAGVETLDLTSALAADKPAAPPFLKTDTHWTPIAMERSAELIAGKIREGWADPRTMAFTRAASQDIANTGDLAAMLRLSPTSSLFPRESVRIRPVRDAAGTPWRPDPAAEILLLGDSFTNIYSTPDLCWGTGAGLAEQLSLALQQPVDRIAINSGGASTARQTLARSPERLAGKRIVVYEFATRELSSGNWEVLPLAEPAANPRGPATSSSTVTGVIREISRAPQPGTVPYKDLVVSIHLAEISSFPSPEILVFLPGMKNHALTSANKLKPGDRVSLRIVPWRSVEEKYGALNRIELSGPGADIGEIYWSDDVPAPEK
ncbi:MAG: hypothetical protein WCS65_02375 [Verrucomicrobiae bacterium]